MDRFNKLNSYFVDKERKRLDAIAKDTKSGLSEMSPAEIKVSCLENGGYETPELNDKIYLHFRGFKKIENLEPYTGCKAIWLDSNGFSEIENLQCLEKLRCLYLSKNLISRILGLDTLKDLTILDLSNNRLTHIDNLQECSSLQTINLSRNFLTSPESIKHFKDCLALQNIDVTNNKLECDEEFFDVLKSIPSLKALSCNGNELTRLPHFRKRLISSISALGYLDRPVDPQERYIADAFMTGGIEGEVQARENWRADQLKRKQEEQEATKKYREEQRKIREVAKNTADSLRAKRLADIADGTLVLNKEEQSELEKGNEKEIKSLSPTRALTKEESEEIESYDSATFSAYKYSYDQACDVFQIKDSKGKEEEGDKDGNDTKMSVYAESSSNNDGNGEDSIKFSKVEESLNPVEIDLEEDHDAMELTEINNLNEQEIELRKVKEENDFIQGKEEKEKNDAAEKEAAQERKVLAMEKEKREKLVSDSVQMFKNQMIVEKNNDKKSEQENQKKKNNVWENGNYEVESKIEEKEEIEMRMKMKILLNEDGDETDVECSGPSSDYYKLRPPLPPSFSSSSSSSTTTSFSTSPSSSSSSSQYLYWSETMDLGLADSIRSCLFDFQAVSDFLTASALKGSLGHSGDRAVREVANGGFSQLTPDACRLRWAELDAEKWSQVAPNTTALDTIHKICVNKSEGGQLNYHSLSSLASGTTSKYLMAPTQFPSVGDNEEEEEEEEEEE